MSTTKRWEELFAGRKWRVGEEYTGLAVLGRDGSWQGDRAPVGPASPGQVSISFDRGRFTITGGAYQSPLSTNKGLHGIILVETDDSGRADLRGPDGCKVRIAVGEPAVQRAREQFGAVW